MNEIPELGRWTKAASFLIGGNEFTGFIPTELGMLKNVSLGFGMWSNTFQGGIPTEIGELTKITHYFHIGHMGVSKTIPSQLGRLSLLSSGGFYLHSNEFTGHAPTELGSIDQLTFLFALNGNALTGVIPTEYGRLQKLSAQFRLNDNSFRGAVPTELGRLTKASNYFLLASNQLCSDIPTEVSGLSTSFLPTPYPSTHPTYWSVAEGNFVGPTPCPATSALVALYEATGGGSWVSRSGWMGSTSGPGDPCTSAWYGVTCDSGEVTVLNMAVNSLLGVLPTELGDLTSMKEGGWHTDNDVYVSLFRSNSLAGSLPSGSLYLCSLASATFSIR